MLQFLIACITLIPFCTIHAQSQENKPKTICLNMIVKNEAAVIQRCLESVLPLIDTWVIVDTGSIDNTQQIIAETLKDIPGELFERPWVNFGFNRQEALELAKSKADYILFMDADDILAFGPNFTLPELTADFYAVATHSPEMECILPRLVKSSIPWKWHGILHEFIIAEYETNGVILQDIEYIYLSDGARSKDPNRYKKDIQILEDALKKDPNDSRNIFYLAISHLAAGDKINAFMYFQQRLTMPGFDEEVYISKLNIAKIQEQLKVSPEIIKASYLEAFKSRPTRIESLYYLAVLMNKEGNYQKGFDIASLALLLHSQDALFIEKWISDYGLLLEYAISAYHTQKFRECYDACQKLLNIPNLPEKQQQEVNKLIIMLQQLTPQNIVEALWDVFSHSAANS